MEGFLEAANAGSPLQTGAELVCSALDHVPFGVAVIDPHGRRVAANRRLGDWASDGILAATVVEEDPALVAALDRALDGASSNLQLARAPLAHRSGVWRVDVAPFETNGVIVGAIVTISDGSEQRRATDAFEASQRRFRVLVDSASDGIACCRDGVLLYANPAGARMLGYDGGDELVGRRLLDFVVEPERARFEDRASNAEEATSARLLESVFVRRDGTQLPVELSISRATLDDGLASFVFFRDVSERIRMRGDLERAQRMDSLGRMAGGIAHDFNNLITAIAASLQLARRADGSTLHEVLNRADAAAFRASDMTQQLLTFSRGSTATCVAVDPNPIVEEVVDLLQAMKNQDVRVETRLDPHAGRIWIAPSQLHQVIFNLLINAWDAIAASGNITVETTRESGSDGVERIRISVADTGVGIDAKTRERMFEPLFTTKPAGGGTGLGLSTAYGIVTRAGGCIEVETAPSEGTTFNVSFPKSAESRDSAPPVDRSPPDDSSGPRDSGQRPQKATVLICDDEVRLAVLTAGLLESHGYRVLTADSANAALDVLRRETVDVLVLDVHLKPKPAAQLLPLLVEIDGDLQVILNSGYAREDIPDELLDDPLVVGYLAKPYPVEELAEMIRGVLRPSEVRQTPR